MLKNIVELLQYRGYHKFSAEGMPGVYVRETEKNIYAVIISVYNHNNTANDYVKLRQGIEFNIVTKNKKHVDSLFLIVNRDGIFDDNLSEIISENDNVWLMAADTGKIYIYENQPANFDDNLNEYLENNLFRISRASSEEYEFSLTPVNIFIVIINVVVYVFVVIVNKNAFAVYDIQTMLRMGALSVESFVNGNWYEIVTSLFLHFGISHLFNNMLLLTYVGSELERRIGSFFYFVIYFVSGICGNAASLWYYNRIGEQNIVSAGASGAIFGVIGCLAIYLLTNPSGSNTLTPRRLMMLAVLTIYYGLTSVGVDNAAHIGGFCFGLLGGFLLSKILHYDKLETVKLMR